MNTCGTCRYFGKPINSREVDWETGMDAAPSPLHKCELIAHDKARENYDVKAAAVVRDGSGFFAVLCVQEEFGCNQWQQITASEKP